jgi:hypothetical protein
MARVAHPGTPLLDFVGERKESEREKRRKSETGTIGEKRKSKPAEKESNHVNVP